MRLVTGSAPWEVPGPTYQMSAVLRNRGIGRARSSTWVKVVSASNRWRTWLSTWSAAPLRACPWRSTWPITVRRGRSWARERRRNQRSDPACFPFFRLNAKAQCVFTRGDKPCVTLRCTKRVARFRKAKPDQRANHVQYRHLRQHATVL